jgi:hypothetical protein
MIGFEADRAWPSATRVRVRIAKGLRGLHGRMLESDVAWTFQTPPIAITDLPRASDQTDLAPKVRFTSNVALDRPSLVAHAFLRSHEAQPQVIPLAIPPDTATASPTASSAPADDDTDFDSSDQSWHYVLAPVSMLARATAYDVVLEPGILPRDGNVASDATFTGTLQTHDALQFLNVTWTAPGRFARGDAQLVFSTPIDPTTLGAISISPAPPSGTTPFAVVDAGVAVNSALLSPDTTYTVRSGTGLRDTYGQALQTAQTMTFRTGDLVPDVWAPSGTSLFPAGKDVRLWAIPTAVTCCRRQTAGRAWTRRRRTMSSEPSKSRSARSSAARPARLPTASRRRSVPSGVFSPRVSSN